jgi:hypothetical protein
MALSTTFLGTLDQAAFAAGSGMSWWQTVGGLAVVFGLLLLSLKLLGKWNRRSGGSDSSLLTVWHLGPKREIQVLRLGDHVHYIYRHDGAMVVLQTEPVADFESKGTDQVSGSSGGNWRESISRSLPFWNVQAEPSMPTKNHRERAASG